MQSIDGVLMKASSDNILVSVAKAAAVSIIGGAIVSLFGTAKDQAVRKMTNSFRISRNESAYAYATIARWLIADGIVSVDRHFSMENFYDDNTGDITIAVPPDGSYFARYEGVRIRIDFSTVENEHGTISNSSRNPRITVIAFGDRKRIVISKIRSLLAHQLSSDSLRIEEYNGHRFILKRKRPLSSIVINDKTKSDLLEHLTWWAGAEEEYATLGLPYKTGILLEGPPGTGKSSLAQAIASHLGFTLVCVDALTLGGRLSDIKRNTVVLIEDIDRDTSITGEMKVTVKSSDLDDVDPDCIPVSDRKRSSKAIGLAHVMNILDGAASPEGIVFLLSANNPELLDPALIRPGRIDLRLHLGYFDEMCAAEMGSIFGVDKATVLALGQDTWREPAKLQLALMRIRQERKGKPKLVG